VNEKFPMDESVFRDDFSLICPYFASVSIVHKKSIEMTSCNQLWNIFIWKNWNYSVAGYRRHSNIFHLISMNSFLQCFSRFTLWNWNAIPRKQWRRHSVKRCRTLYADCHQPWVQSTVKRCCPHQMASFIKHQS